MSNIQSQVVNLVARGYKPSVISDQLGIPFSKVLELSSPDKPHSFDLGKKSLRRHLIAVKRSAEEWPAKFSRQINLARMQYDAGLVEMFQGRDGEYILLYAKKRQVPLTEERAYFSTMGAA